jgi:EAL domain-containing protein (putative c-di-GMP-specific phosphodiesterase class I)/GGDEF domain-containing protein/DNA-binding NarL/FixJ family response regulator|tara:strand:+ start:6373 stop:8478 length:2106 start_codon:yes stop_codon:yes gene_type:complete
MRSNEPLHILIVDKSNDEANRYISILRSADFVVEAKLATNEEQLQKTISMRNWDLLLASQDYSKIPTQNIFQRIRRAERDLPVILISQKYNPKKVIEGMRLGAVDVVVEDQDQHLIKVVERSLGGVYERRQSREWERKLSVAERRAQHLMDISRYPIAIIKEGVYIYANDACASVFGFSDSEEMLCMPVIDNIGARDREKLKAYMVPLQSSDEIMPFEAVIKTLDIDGAESDAFLEIQQVQYDAEPALQFTINKDKLFDANMDHSEQQKTTEYSAIQPHLVYELISRGISRSVQSGQDCMLLNIQADRFSQLKEDLGIAKAEKVAHSLVMFIVQLFDHNLDCGRVSENCFVIVLPDTTEEKAVELAADICQQIGQQVFDIDDETFSLTTSIGITGLNENVPSVERGLERSEEAISQLREDNSPGNGAKFYIPDIHSDDISKAEAVVITAKNLLSKGAFSIRYQPIVALIDGGSGKEYYEVILGIKKDVPVSEIPEDFITNLFKSEIAAEVDRWVIGQALSSLNEKLKTNPETQLFINISAQSFADSEFLPWLQKALSVSKLPPNALIFQFREIDAVRYLNQAAALCEEMKKAKGQVGISNFGLAINPLKTLERVKADFVKIDRLIVEKLANAGQGNAPDQSKEEFQKIMGGMTGTGVDVIVPFVETAAIIPILWQQGVQYIQGHYINQPSFTMDYDFSEGP